MKIKKLSKLEIVIYAATAICLLGMIALGQISEVRNQISRQMSYLDGKVLFSFSLFVPALLMSSVILSSFSKDPLTLAKLITPPIRVGSDTLVSKVSFTMFWVGVNLLFFARILLLPNLPSIE